MKVDIGIHNVQIHTHIHKYICHTHTHAIEIIQIHRKFLTALSLGRHCRMKCPHCIAIENTSYLSYMKAKTISLAY